MTRCRRPVTLLVWLLTLPVNLAVGALPQADDCGDAVPIVVPDDGAVGFFPFSNVGAGNSSADGFCGPFSADVWYETQPIAGRIRVSTCSSWGGEAPMATILATYLTCGQEPVSCNSWGCNSMQSTVSFVVTSPAAVYIRIATRLEPRVVPAEGNGTFTVIVTPCQTCESIAGSCGTVDDLVCNRTLSCTPCVTTAPTTAVGVIPNGTGFGTTGARFDFGTWRTAFDGPTLFGHRGLIDHATGRIWMHGGFQIGAVTGIQSTIRALDAATSTFTEVTVAGGTAPSMYNHAGVYAAGKIIVHGGAVIIDGQAESLDALDYFDVASSTWYNLGNHTPARYGHSMVLSERGDKIVVFGGIDTTGVPYATGLQTDMLEFLDPVTMQWTSAAEAGVTGFSPSGRYYHAAVLIRDNIMLVYGGVAFDGFSAGEAEPLQEVLTDVWLFDIDNASWGYTQPQPTGPAPRSFGHQAVYSRERHAVVLFGGLEQTATGFTYRNRVYVLDLQSWNWALLPPNATAGGPTPSPRYLFAAVLLGSAMLIHGGIGTTGVQSSAFWFDITPRLAATSLPERPLATAQPILDNEDLAIGLGVGLGGGLLFVIAFLVLGFAVFRRRTYRARKSEAVQLDSLAVASNGSVDLTGVKIDAGGGAVSGPPLDADELALQLQFPAHYLLDFRSLAIECQLGSGAFGVVYAARLHGTAVVVKQSIASDELNRKLFYKEALAMTRLHPFHPNIVQLVGVCVNPEQPLALVLEWVDGGSLDNLLKDQKAVVTEDLAWALCRDIAAGMRYLHRHEVLHCDLSARNVLLSPRKDTYVAKIADFGLSHIVSDGAGGIYTAEGPLKVPIRWTAPEILEHPTQHSKAGDVWSFGVVMWEILERDIPYSDLPENSQVILAVSRGHRLKAPTTVPHSTPLDDVMFSCFRTNPAERPSFAELHDKLQSIAIAGEEASTEASDDPADAELARKRSKASDAGNYHDGSDLGTPPQVGAHLYDAKLSSTSSATNSPARTTRADEGAYETSQAALSASGGARPDPNNAYDSIRGSNHSAYNNALRSSSSIDNRPYDADRTVASSQHHVAFESDDKDRANAAGAAAADILERPPSAHYENTPATTSSITSLLSSGGSRSPADSPPLPRDDGSAQAHGV